MSVFDRFKNRDNAPTKLEVPFPMNEPELIFTVERFSPAENNEAQIDAEGQLSRRGVKRGDPEYDAHYGQALCYELAKFVKRHIKTWKHTPKDGSEPIAFSSGQLEQLFNSFSIAERTELGVSYYVLEQQALHGKKKESLNEEK